MDIRKVKKLIELLEQSQIAEIEIKEGEESVRISRASKAAPTQTVIQVPETAAAPAALPAPAAAAPPAATNSVVQEMEGHVVTAPMVGTYYASPAPGSPPFVEVGKRVKKGDVLCIIEAMKIMNPIEADTDGYITSILVETGQPVEYGQPLMVIKP